MLSSFLGAKLFQNLVLGTALAGASFWGGVWMVLALILVVLSLALILVILIQDPKGGGLASAFGAGPGGDSILGAQATKDITRITTVLSVLVGIIVIGLVWVGHMENEGISSTINNPNANTQNTISDPDADAETGSPSVPGPGGTPPNPNSTSSSSSNPIVIPPGNNPTPGAPNNTTTPDPNKTETPNSTEANNTQANTTNSTSQGGQPQETSTPKTVTEETPTTNSTSQDGQPQETSTPKTAEQPKTDG